MTPPHASNHGFPHIIAGCHSAPRSALDNAGMVCYTYFDVQTISGRNRVRIPRDDTIMTREPAEIINEYLMQMAENLPLFRQFTPATTLLKDLTPQELHTIAMIGKMGSPKMSDLARRGRVTLGTMTVMVNKLVRKGYAKRRRQASDRRVVRVSLTPSGRKMDRVHEQFHKDLVDRIMAMLTQAEQQQVARIIQKIATSLA